MESISDWLNSLINSINLFCVITLEGESARISNVKHHSSLHGNDGPLPFQGWRLFSDSIRK